VELPTDLETPPENSPLFSPEPASRYDDEGFPEDSRGLLSLSRHGDEYFVSIRGVADPFLLYAQFANRQRDAVFLARDGSLRDPLPDGSFSEIPYGYGALKTNTAYISLVEAIILPHVSDNQKGYEVFPLQDLYLGGSLGMTGLLAELRYVHAERTFGYARAGINLFGGAGGAVGEAVAPLGYYALGLHFGAGVQFPGILENLIGPNHWSAGADLLLGLGDADRDPATPAAVWMPGVFLELEKRDLFGWGSRWAGFGPQGEFRQDPRPLNYHVRGLYARLGAYLDLQNGAGTGYLKIDAALGFRYNILGPRIPEHRFKETRAVYLNDEYREQVARQLERRAERIQAEQPQAVPGLPQQQ